jgi:hypothetical protein
VGEAQNHQDLANKLIEPGKEIEITGGTVVRSERLGGMLNYYYQEAA